MRTPGHAIFDSKSLDSELLIVAARQYGAFSREQARAFGATRSMVQHRLDSGRWEQLTKSVFRFAGALPSWRQSLMGACLAWGKDARASHRSAAALLKLVGFSEGIIELNVPKGRDRKELGIIHRNILLPSDVTSIDGIPTTGAYRTLLDIAGVCPFDVVEEALDDALRRRIIRVPLLKARLLNEARSGLDGVTVLRSLVSARGEGAVPESPLETRLLRALLKAGLPRPVVQHKVRVGRRFVFIDLAYPERFVAIEAEGYQWHHGRPRFERDLARRNELTLLGWKVIHVTWLQFDRNPDAVVADIAKALMT
jgi:very-short-patch-repair endonuclease